VVSEVHDQFEVLQTVHKGLSAMIAGLSKEKLVEKPAEHFNNIASLLEHILLTEKRFLAGISEGDTDIDIMAPFNASEWNVEQILFDWQASLKTAEEVLSKLTVEDLSTPGLKLRSGDVINKRQVVTYMVLHAAHHRGQIPLIKKLLVV
jgi:uncharacterized damage-inducible protein DinB